MNSPAEGLQDGLAQPISVTGRAGAVIRRAIALYTEQVSTRRIGINYCQIEKEACGSDLGVYRVTAPLQCAYYLFLKRRIRRAACSEWNIQIPMLGVGQECFQRLYAVATAFGIDVFRTNGGKHLAAN